MYFDKPALSPSFKLEEALKLIEQTIKEKHWTQFNVASISLIFTPYWVFSFEAFSTAGSGSGAGAAEGESAGAEEDFSFGAVSDTQSGELSFSAVDSEVNEEIASLLDEGELIQQPEEGYKFEALRAKIRLNEAKEIAKIKAAHSASVPKDNVIVSNLRMVYFPEWVADVEVAQGTFELTINGVTGEIFSTEEIPKRKKGWLELSAETLKELQSPGAWIKYSSEIGGGAVKAFSGSRFMHDKRFQIIVLALIAILVVLWTYFY
ncbi:MAG: hypothetical protein V1494_05535 [Candidatus Diapherotrites archaeon]